VPDLIVKRLRNAGLVPSQRPVDAVSLPGGVSSDIWKIETPDCTYCVKRARERLKVAAEWHAPLERNHYEVRWYRIANRVAPGSAPTALGAMSADALSRRCSTSSSPSTTPDSSSC